MNLTNRTAIPLALKLWIENTQLFAVIKYHTTSGGMGGVMPRIRGVDPPLQLSLQQGIVIEKAEDLPIEIIEEFWRNSPFFEEPPQEQYLLSNV